MSDLNDPTQDTPPGDDDPINASGDFVFKRFGRETRPEPDQGEQQELDDVVQALSPAEAPAPEPAPAALMITFQTWATPVVGIVMLVLGLLGGYFLRPLIRPDANTPTASLDDPATDSTGTQTQSSPEDRAALMAALLPSVRHFLGDPDAPITLIEFSDFQ